MLFIFVLVEFEVVFVIASTYTSVLLFESSYWSSIITTSSPAKGSTSVGFYYYYEGDYAKAKLLFN